MTAMEEDVDDRFAGIDIDSLLNRVERRPISAGRKKALYEAPEFIQRLCGEETVLEGQSLCIECKVRGFPAPALRWFKDDEEILDHPRIHIQSNGIGGYCLFIDNVNKGDEAAYRCRAENVEGACSSFFFLSVKGKPKANKKKDSPNRRTVSFPPMFSTIVEKVEEEEKQGKELEELPPSPLTEFYYALTLKGRQTWPTFLGEWAFANAGHAHKRRTDDDDDDDDEEEDNDSRNCVSIPNGDDPDKSSREKREVAGRGLRRSDLTARAEAKKRRLQEEAKNKKEAEENKVKKEKEEQKRKEIEERKRRETEEKRLEHERKDREGAMKQRRKEREERTQEEFSRKEEEADKRKKVLLEEERFKSEEDRGKKNEENRKVREQMRKEEEKGKEEERKREEEESKRREQEKRKREEEEKHRREEKEKKEEETRRKKEAEREKKEKERKKREAEDKERKERVKKYGQELAEERKRKRDVEEQRQKDQEERKKLEEVEKQKERERKESPLKTTEKEKMERKLDWKENGSKVEQAKEANHARKSTGQKNVLQKFAQHLQSPPHVPSSPPPTFPLPVTNIHPKALRVFQEKTDQVSGNKADNSTLQKETSPLRLRAGGETQQPAKSASFQTSKAGKDIPRNNVRPETGEKTVNGVKPVDTLQTQKESKIEFWQQKQNIKNNQSNASSIVKKPAAPSRLDELRQKEQQRLDELRNKEKSRNDFQSREINKREREEKPRVQSRLDELRQKDKERLDELRQKDQQRLEELKQKEQQRWDELKQEQQKQVDHMKNKDKIVGDVRGKEVNQRVSLREREQKQREELRRKEEQQREELRQREFKQLDTLRQKEQTQMDALKSKQTCQEQQSSRHEQKEAQKRVETQREELRMKEIRQIEDLKFDEIKQKEKLKWKEKKQLEELKERQEQQSEQQSEQLRLKEEFMCKHLRQKDELQTKKDEEVRREYRKEQIRKEQLRRQHDQERQKHQQKLTQEEDRRGRHETEKDDEFHVKVYKRDYSFAELCNSLEAHLGGNVIDVEEHKYWDDILEKHQYSISDLRKAFDSVASANSERQSRSRARVNSIEDSELSRMKRSSSISDLREAYTKSLERPKKKTIDEVHKDEEFLKRAASITDLRQQFLEVVEKQAQTSKTSSLPGKTEAEITIQRLKPETPFGDIRQRSKSPSLSRFSPAPAQESQEEPRHLSRTWAELNKLIPSVAAKRASFHELLTQNQKSADVVRNEKLKKRMSYHQERDIYGSKEIPTYRRAANWVDDVEKSLDIKNPDKWEGSGECLSGNLLAAPKLMASNSKDGAGDLDTASDTKVRPFVYNSARTIARNSTGSMTSDSGEYSSDDEVFSDHHNDNDDDEDKPFANKPHFYTNDDCSSSGSDASPAEAGLIVYNSHLLSGCICSDPKDEQLQNSENNNLILSANNTETERLDNKRDQRERISTKVDNPQLTDLMNNVTVTPDSTRSSPPVQELDNSSNVFSTHKAPEGEQTGICQDVAVLEARGDLTPPIVVQLWVEGKASLPSQTSSSQRLYSEDRIKPNLNVATTEPVREEREATPFYLDSTKFRQTCPSLNGSQLSVEDTEIDNVNRIRRELTPFFEDKTKTKSSARDSYLNVSEQELSEEDRREFRRSPTPFFDKTTKTLAAVSGPISSPSPTLMVPVRGPRQSTPYYDENAENGNFQEKSRSKIPSHPSITGENKGKTRPNLMLSVPDRTSIEDAGVLEADIISEERQAPKQTRQEKRSSKVLKAQSPKTLEISPSKAKTALISPDSPVLICHAAPSLSSLSLDEGILQSVDQSGRSAGQTIPPKPSSELRTYAELLNAATSCSKVQTPSLITETLSKPSPDTAHVTKKLSVNGTSESIVQGESLKSKEYMSQTSEAAFVQSRSVVNSSRDKLLPRVVKLDIPSEAKTVSSVARPGLSVAGPVTSTGENVSSSALRKVLAATQVAKPMPSRRLGVSPAAQAVSTTRDTQTFFPPESQTRAAQTFRNSDMCGAAGQTAQHTIQPGGKTTSLDKMYLPSPPLATVKPTQSVTESSIQMKVQIAKQEGGILSFNTSPVCVKENYGQLQVALPTTASLPSSSHANVKSKIIAVSGASISCFAAGDRSTGQTGDLTSSTAKTAPVKTPKMAPLAIAETLTPEMFKSSQLSGSKRRARLQELRVTPTPEKTRQPQEEQQLHPTIVRPKQKSSSTGFNSSSLQPPVSYTENKSFAETASKRKESKKLGLTNALSTMFQHVYTRSALSKDTRHGKDKNKYKKSLFVKEGGKHKRYLFHNPSGETSEAVRRDRSLSASDLAKISPFGPYTLEAFCFLLVMTLVCLHQDMPVEKFVCYVLASYYTFCVLRILGVVE